MESIPVPLVRRTGDGDSDAGGSGTKMYCGVGAGTTSCAARRHLTGCHMFAALCLRPVHRGACEPKPETKALLEWQG